MTKRIAIIGAGAAGLAAAVSAAQTAERTGESCQITLYEIDERVGKRILATGNGRCNFENADIVYSVYHNGDFVREVAASNDPERTLVLNFFEDLGLAWTEEEGKRLYPRTNKASTVVDVLRAALVRHGVTACCNTTIGELFTTTSPDGVPAIHFRAADGRIFHADAAIIASGGLDSLRYIVETMPGLHDIPFTPLLGALKTDTEAIRALENIRVRARVTLRRSPIGAAVPADAARTNDFRMPGESETALAQESGEVLFRKFGVSGIVIFNLSREALPGDTLEINLVPEYDPAHVADMLRTRAAHLAERDAASTFSELLRGFIVPQLADAAMQARHVPDKRLADATENDFAALAHALTAFTLTVRGIAEPKFCQIHRGGLSCACFDPTTLEAKDYPALFAAGEALDVDGPCGGYNLHWAWLSGIVAGRSAVKTSFPQGNTTM